MRSILLQLAVLSLVVVSGALAADFSGVVVDRESGLPLPGATITIENQNRAIPAAEAGRFALSIDEPTVVVSVSHVGYKTVHGLSLTAGSEIRIELARSISVLDGIVVTANRYEKEAFKTSQPVTSSGAAEIEAKGYSIVTDIVRDYPGLDVNDAGPFRARPVIRGLFGTRILVLVDGERLNDQRDISSFAGVSMSLVDVNEIERVEVVNGPSSVLYGSDAMGGVINIITKKNGFNGVLKPWGRYHGTYMSAGEQHSQRVDFGLEGKKVTGSLGFSYREALDDYNPPKDWNKNPELFVFRPSFYDSLNERTGRDFTNRGLVNSRARVNNYDGKLAYKLSDRHRLDADFGAFRGHDIGYPGVPNDSTPFWFFYPKHNRDHFSLTYAGKGLTPRLAKLEAKFYYERIYKDFLTDFLGFTIPAGPGMFISPVTATNSTDVKKYGVNLQNIYAVGPKMNLTGGIDFLHEGIEGHVTEITHFEGFGPFPFNDTTVGSSVPENSWNSLGIFASGDVTFNRLQTTLGLRFDNFWVKTKATDGYTDDNDEPLPTESENYNSLNGSLGLVYRLGGGVNLVGNVGTSYRVPNVVERFYFGSASNRETRPNQNIKPEKAVSLDFGVKAIHEHVNYSLIGFYSDYTDFTQLQKFDSLPPAHPGEGYTPLWRYENIEDVTIYGFEGVVEADLTGGLYGKASAAWQHGELNTFNQPLFVTPLKISLTAGYRFQKYGLFAEGTLRTIGDQTRVPDVAYLDDVPSKGYTILNATIGCRPFKGVRLSLTGVNLTDEVYAEPFNSRNPDNPIVEAGRNFVMSLSAGF